MGVFGQRIPENIWSFPLYGFYNFHPCAGVAWPSNVGPHPFESMASDSESRGSVAMHMVDNEFDHGPLVSFSEFFPVFPQEGVMAASRRTSPLAAGLMAWHIAQILSLPCNDAPRVIVEEQMALFHNLAATSPAESSRTVV
jgi:methionyl-tRNA formyltransferase